MCPAWRRTFSEYIECQHPASIPTFKTFRDPVHLDIKLTELETRIVDTPEFQRLGRVRQLGTTNLVYRGAVHTRFDHALGTLHMADRIVRAVNDNPDTKQIDEGVRMVTRLVALLHDITHVPYGHTLEDEANLYPRHDEPDNFAERMGPGTNIGTLISEALGPAELDRVLAVLTAKGDLVGRLGADAVAADIVSNTICADLLDYLNRDTYFCGLDEACGSRFIDYLYVPRSGDYEDRLVLRLHKLKSDRFRPDVLFEVMGLLRLRYRLAEVVYYHHNKMCTSAMISAAVARSPMATDRHALYDVSDDELVSMLARDREWPGSARVATALRDRTLYVPAYLVNYVSPTAVDKKRLGIERLKQDYNSGVGAVANRREVEDLLARSIGGQPGDVIIYCPSGRMQLKIAEARVAWSRDEIEVLQSAFDASYASEIKTIQERHRALWKFIVYVHPALTDKAVKLGQLSEEFFGLRNELADGATPQSRMDTLKQHAGVARSVVEQWLETDEAAFAHADIRTGAVDEVDIAGVRVHNLLLHVDAGVADGWQPARGREYAESVCRERPDEVYEKAASGSILGRRRGTGSKSADDSGARIRVALDRLCEADGEPHTLI